MQGNAFIGFIPVVTIGLTMLGNYIYLNAPKWWREYKTPSWKPNPIYNHMKRNSKGAIFKVEKDYEYESYNDYGIKTKKQYYKIYILDETIGEWLVALRDGSIYSKDCSPETGYLRDVRSNMFLHEDVIKIVENYSYNKFYNKHIIEPQLYVEKHNKEVHHKRLTTFNILTDNKNL